MMRSLGRVRGVMLGCLVAWLLFPSASRPAFTQTDVQKDRAPRVSGTKAEVKIPGAARVLLQGYNGPSVPVNGDGDTYPSILPGTGTATLDLDATDAVTGKSLRITQTAGKESVQIQFNPYNYAGNPSYPSPRGWARDYAEERTHWQFNRFNRMRFWVKAPVNGPALRRDGTSNVSFGQYVKRITQPNLFSDEEGGGHPYNGLNIPNTGTWSQVILNMHPDHWRGEAGGREWGQQPYPTGETNHYNYYDTFTRFYFQAETLPASFPATYRFDEFEFYDEPHQENDAQIYAVVATYVPSSNRVIVTWDRNKDENSIRHEVRYAFSNIHVLGWTNALEAPNGTVTPPGWQGYNGMVYETEQLPLAGRTEVYIAIKPKNSDLYTQVRIPLELDGPSSRDTRPPLAPKGLTVR